MFSSPSSPNSSPRTQQQRFSIKETLITYQEPLKAIVYFSAGASTALLLRSTAWQRRKEPLFWWLGRRDHGKAMANCGISPHFVDQQLDRRGYAVGYSYAFMSPLCTSFIVSDKVIQGKGLNEDGGARIEPFGADGEIPSKYRPRVADFSSAAVGFHRGHLAARATVGFSPAAARETFLLSNVALMTPYCNGVAFKRIEQLTREWALTFEGDLAVVTGPIFDLPPHKVARIVSSPPSSSSSSTSTEAVSSSETRARQQKANHKNRDDATETIRENSRVASSNDNLSSTLDHHNGSGAGGREGAVDPHRFAQYQQYCAKGAPIPAAFFYTVLHIPTGNTIAFVVRNAEKKSSAMSTAARSKANKNNSNDALLAAESEEGEGEHLNSAARTPSSSSASLISTSLPFTLDGFSRRNVIVMPLETLEQQLGEMYSGYGKRFLSSRRRDEDGGDDGDAKGKGGGGGEVKDSNARAAGKESRKTVSSAANTQQQGSGKRKKGAMASKPSKISGSGSSKPAVFAHQPQQQQAPSNAPMLGPTDNEEDVIFINKQSLTNRIVKSVWGILSVPMRATMKIVTAPFRRAAAAVVSCCGGGGGNGMRVTTSSLLSSASPHPPAVSVRFFTHFEEQSYCRRFIRALTLNAAARRGANGPSTTAEKAEEGGGSPLHQKEKGKGGRKSGAHGSNKPSASPPSLFRRGGGVNRTVVNRQFWGI